VPGFHRVFQKVQLFSVTPATPQESLPQNRTHTTELFSVVCHTGQSVKLCFGYKITSERWWSVLIYKKNPLQSTKMKIQWTKKRLATIHCNPTTKRTLQYFLVNMKSMEEKSRLSKPAFTHEKCQNFCNCLFEVNWKFRGPYTPEVIMWASVQMH